MERALYRVGSARPPPVLSVKTPATNRVIYVAEEATVVHEDFMAHPEKAVSFLKGKVPQGPKRVACLYARCVFYLAELDLELSSSGNWQIFY